MVSRSRASPPAARSATRCARSPFRSAAARTAFASAAEEVTGSRRAQALDQEGALALAARDPAAARRASLDALAAASRPPPPARAAAPPLSIRGTHAAAHGLTQDTVIKDIIERVPVP